MWIILRRDEAVSLKAFETDWIISEMFRFEKLRLECETSLALSLSSPNVHKGNQGELVLAGKLLVSLLASYFSAWNCVLINFRDDFTDVLTFENFSQMPTEQSFHGDNRLLQNEWSIHKIHWLIRSASLITLLHSYRRLRNNGGALLVIMSGSASGTRIRTKYICQLSRSNFRLNLLLCFHYIFVITFS